MREINRIILHASASDDPKVDVAEVRRWHLARNFRDVGYHWFIKTDGTIQAGRPLEQIGAHCSGENYDSIGVCLNGLTDFKMEQFNSLKQLLVSIHKKYPHCTLHGHREFNPHKTCPVFDYDPFIQFWDSLGTEFGEGG